MKMKIIIYFTFSFNILMAIILAMQGVNPNKEDYIIIMICALIILNGFISGVSVYKITTMNKSEELRERIKELENLNNEIRSKNHDALNHIQIVNGLIELQEYEEVKKYINPLYRGLISLNDLNKSTCIPFNALLLNEYEVINEKGIKINYLINSTLQENPLEDFELCEIVKDILDKSVLLLKDNRENPQINLKVDDLEEVIVVKFESNGNEVPVELRERYPDLSKVSQDLHSLSFAKSKNILNRVNCNVRFYTDEEFNVIEICLKRNKS